MKHSILAEVVRDYRAWRVLPGFLMLLISLFQASPAHASEGVLVLNSYHRGKALSDDTIDAIVAGLQVKHPTASIYIEDMDTKRHSLEDVRADLLTCYAKKYRDVHLDAIVTIDNSAFEFALAYREELFPGLPLVFTGLNGFQPSVLSGVNDVTGVVEATDIEGTVRLALALHPKTTHLAVVTDCTLSGRAMLEEFRREAESLPGSLEIVELAELAESELLAALDRLPRESVVLRCSFFRDANGRSFSIEEQARLLTQAGLPVYDFWDEAIGLGYVGGFLVTGASQGKAALGMLERILAGEKPENIDVLARSPNAPIFDKRALVRTGADLSQLPVNAVLRFDEPSVWERYPRLLAAMAVGSLLLLGLAVFFAVLSVQRKRHALALSYEEQKLRATLDSIGEGVVTINSRGEIEQLNSMASRWIGLSKEAVHGRPVGEIFRLKGASTEDAIESATDSDSLPVESGLLMTASGRRIPIALSAAPITLPKGGQSGTVMVFRDMTREHKLQQETAEVRRLDALGQLAGGVAHDFNNLLGAIVGATELLRLRVTEDEGVEFLDLILDSADNAAQLTGQLLSFARKQSVASDTVGIHQVIGDAVSVLERTVDPRIEIEVRAQAGLNVVRGDRTMLHSSLLNLGINASHAMPMGGTLSFSTSEVSLDDGDCEGSSFELNSGRYIEVRIEDDGSGIAPEVIDRIFEPFFTTKDQGKGTGLGLAAVFGTVQQHSGSVTVQSEPGKGTCFIIRLPLVERVATAPAPLQDREVKGKGVILVVDDEASLRNLAQETLEHLGYQVLTARNGVEALKVFDREGARIDLVLLDMVMPKMNGRDCFAELQKTYPGVRVISASGLVDQEDLDDMTRMGLVGHLTKPYRRTDLSRAIWMALQPVGSESRPESQPTS